MMRKIGIDGGHSIYELGPTSDVELFFECLSTFVPKSRPDRDWSLLTDRFYRRYLKHEELPEAEALMKEVRSVFATKGSDVIDWRSWSIDRDQSWLDKSLPTLADVFAEYFEKLAAAIRSAESFNDVFHIYQPVRLVISDLPGYARDKNKPLADYDALTGRPFWLQ